MTAPDQIQVTIPLGRIANACDVPDWILGQARAAANRRAAERDMKAIGDPRIDFPGSVGGVEASADITLWRFTFDAKAVAS